MSKRGSKGASQGKQNPPGAVVESAAPLRGRHKAGQG